MLNRLRQMFAKSEPPRVYTDRLHGPGSFSIEVECATDDKRNLDLFWKATSNQWKQHKTPEGDTYWDHKTDARLVSEHANQEDPRAIGVEIAGKIVGYLNRGHGLKVRMRLNRLKFDRINCGCKALITGRPEYFTVTVDMPEEWLPAPKTESGQADK